MARGEETNHQPAERMPDEHEWRRHGVSFEQLVQFVGDSSCRSRKRTRITPSKSRAIVRAHLGDTADGWRHKTPAERRPAERCVEYDGRRALAGTVDVQAVRAKIDEASG